MLSGFSWVLPKVLKLASILPPTSLNAQSKAGGSLFFVVALAPNGANSWIFNVDLFCSSWLTFSEQPNRMCNMNVFSADF